MHPQLTGIGPNSAGLTAGFCSALGDWMELLAIPLLLFGLAKLV